MVATRRGAQTTGDEVVVEEDPDLILKRRPARRVAAKNAPAARGATRTRATHSADTGDDLEAENLESEPPALQKKAIRQKRTAASVAATTGNEEKSDAAQPKKAAKGGSVRAKRGLVVTEDAEDELVGDSEQGVDVPKTRSTRTRTAEASGNDELAEALPKLIRPGKSAAAKGRKQELSIAPVHLPMPQPPQPARRTRGAAAKSRPLSPEKITQVPRTRGRPAKDAIEGQKSTAKATQAKAARTVKGGRTPAVSDENAEVHEFSVAISDDGADDDIVMLSSTPKKAPSATVQSRPTYDATDDLDRTMSSRPTTPNDSPTPSLESVEDAEELREADDSYSEPEADTASEVDHSEDELCGPKTPMKRSSPGASARYQSSVQRTVRKYDELVQTPVRGFQLTASKAGTPQTYKSSFKPILPTSASHHSGTSETSDHNSIHDHSQHDTEADHGEVSFVPDDDIIAEADVTPTPEEPTYLGPAMESDQGECFDVCVADEAAEGDFVDPAAVQLFSEDPDETVVIREVDDDLAFADHMPLEALDTEDTVIINHDSRRPGSEAFEFANYEGHKSNEMVQSSPRSIEHNDQTTPRRIVQDTTITVNFDEHLMDIRMTPYGTRAVLEVPAAPTLTPDVEADAVLGAEREDDDMSDESTLDESRCQTIDLNHFIDMEALSEPIAVLNINGEIPPSAEDGDSFLKEEIEEESTEQAEGTEEADKDPAELEVPTETPVPHYALPTIAFDARRKSLPALGQPTPVKAGTRPSTSDGQSMPRLANPFAYGWTARSRAGSTVSSPSKVQPVAPTTPSRSSVCTPQKVRTPTGAVLSTLATPKERYPLLSRQAQQAHPQTVAAPRFATPKMKSPRRRETFHKGSDRPDIVRPTSVNATPPSTPKAPVTPKERYPVLRSASKHIDHARTVAAPLRFQTTQKQDPKRRETFHKAAHGRLNLPIASEKSVTPASRPLNTPTVVTQERYPRLNTRRDNGEVAETVAGPVRFNTPVKSALKRPATVARPQSLRKAALMASSPYTPVKTPLKAPAMTPSQVPMTPHPAAPLSGVVALVEVFTLEGASASAPFIALLHRLGARTTRSWTAQITHVVFKDGSPLTLQKVRLHNKDVEQSGKGAFIHCVNSRWVTDCDTSGARADETDEEYLVDVSEVPRGGKRRRKSMEPSALMNLGGNIVRDRNRSLGRNSSISRSSLKLDAPVKMPSDLPGTPDAATSGKENSGDEHGSPETPVWIAAPDQLVQQTAPMKRVRKLELADKEAKNRRLTFWNGTAR